MTRQQIGNVYGVTQASVGDARVRDTFSLTVSDADGGNFDLTVNGLAVNDIDWNATAGEVATAINTVLAAAGLEVTVAATGGPGGTNPIIVSFVTLAGGNTIVGDGSDLTSEGDPTLTVTQTAVATGVDSPTNLSGTDDPTKGFVDTDLDSVSAMRARLKAIDSGLYTDAHLDGLSYNDMMYAIRVNDHAVGIKQ